MFIIFLIALFVCGWYFLWKKKYFILIESAGENADGITQVLKTQLEISLTQAEELAGSLPKTVRGGNYLNAKMVVKAINEAGGSAKMLFSGEDALSKNEQPKVDENGKNVKEADSDTVHMMGGYAFSADDVDAAKASNEKAYAKLVEAMEVGGEDFYPETLEETQKMDALLDESEKAAKGNADPEYRKVLKEMRGVVGWSSRRHFNFSWLIILGSLIFIGIVVYLGNDKREYKKISKAKVERVEAWSTSKDTLSLDRARQIVNYDNRLLSPNMYRADLINEKEKLIKSYKESIERVQSQLDTATIKSKKEIYQENLANYKKKVAQLNKEIQDVYSWDEAATKEVALEDVKHWYKIAAGKALKGTIFMILALLLIPLYIFANYSWGYVITKTRKESAIIAKITEWTYKIAGGMFGIGLLIPTIRDNHGSGYTPRGLSSNDGNSAMNAILWTAKLCLLFGAILLISVVSLFIMIYSIIVGLKRNYGSKA